MSTDQPGNRAPLSRKPQTSPADLDETHLETSDTGDDFISPQAKTRVDSTLPAPKSPMATAKTRVDTAPSKPAEEEEIPQFSNYEIERKLGQGGMGAVYLARQVNLDRMCALKVMMRDLAKNQQFVARFQREAKAMARIEHPNLVRCYDVGVENGINYIAMELIDGKSMQDWLDLQRVIPVGDAIHVTLLVAEALKQAHSLKMVHRDIKPDNILVTKKGVVKVSDLGLAKHTEEDMSMTQSGTGLGTPHYMAPEQARNAKYVDGRSDIYALGCTLYHFLSGKRPFSANSTLELIMEKEKGRYEPTRKSNLKVPEKLDLIIDKMMMKSPEHRYQNCDDLIRDLENLGLTSPALTFIPAADKVSMRTGPSSSSSVTSSGKSATTSPLAGTPRSSQYDAQKSKLRQDPNRLWYVKQPGPDGKVTSAKLKTPQIITFLQNGKMNLKAQVTDDPKKPFIAIAQVKEFDDECNKLFVKMNADNKAHQLKDKFSEIDRQYRWRKVWQSIDKLKTNMLGTLGLVVWLALIGAVCLGIWSYRVPLIKFVQNNTGMNLHLLPEENSVPATIPPAAP
jgi:serine/threonine-protein kinase